MTIAFTICSANYLPFAKALADSVVKHNPLCRFVIALADMYTDYDATLFSPHPVIPVTEMQLPFLKEMNDRYTIFELSCALKPYVSSYLLDANPHCATLFYFDADILVYHSLTEAEAALQNHSLLVTPHVATPLTYKEGINTELNVLRTGLYNAGFFGISRCAEAFAFLNWWQQRVRYHCFNNAANGLFVDQLWLDLAPLYFRNSVVLYHPGYNLAYWNFAERTLTNHGGAYWVNELYPLVFFHYSGYSLQQPDVISKHRPNYTFSDFALYKPLFDTYVVAIEGNRLQAFMALPATMGKPVKKRKRFKLF